MEKPLLPVKFLTDLNRNFPDAWRYADQTRAMPGDKIPDWPREVFLPYGAWYPIACQLYGARQLDHIQIQLIGKLAAAGAWRPGQDIVRFEPGLAASLMDTELVGDIPADTLWRLPAWCVYIEQEIEVYNVPYAGFFAFLEQDAASGNRELRLHFLRETDDFGFAVPLGKWSLAEALDRMAAGIRKGAAVAGIDSLSAAYLARGDVFMAGAQKAVNLLLYLCAYGFGDQKRDPLARADYPSAKKTKKGWRLFPPDRPAIHSPGQKLAKALREAAERQAAQTGIHASPRPHIRRAHWHGYWLGAKEERRFDLRWLPPIAVAMKDED
ncbi:MAG: hypothetical protein HDQ91_01965 [Desulfovibrio sp.]|nr:hypothetical protein [Desulfovibrio sp.]